MNEDGMNAHKTFSRKRNASALSVCLIAVVAICLLAGCINNGTPPKPNRPPSAVISSPFDNSTFEVGENITFDGTSSVDPEGNALTFSWALGDGTIKKESKFTYAYSSTGTYNVVLGTSDGKKTNSTKARITIKPANRPPVPFFIVSANVTITGDAIFFNASQTGDPDGNALNYSWDFGDGAKGFGMNVSHAYSTPGLYTATLNASDGRLATGTSRAIAVFGKIGIFVDWNGTKYDYRLAIDGPANASFVKANVKDETTGTTWTANVIDEGSNASHLACRLESGFTPIAGHTIAVNVLYYDHDIASRRMTISGENLAPAHDCEVNYSGTINSTILGAKSEYMNISAKGMMNVTGSVVKMRISATGTMYSAELSDDKTKTFDAYIASGSFFEDWTNGTRTRYGSDMRMLGNMTERDSSGNTTLTARLGMNSSLLDGKTTNASSFLYGSIYNPNEIFMNITTETLGSGTHANATGIEYECIIIDQTQTLEANMNIGGEARQVRIINNSRSWACVDEALENTTIFIEYNSTTYVYNATTGELNSTTYINGSLYPDENSDGRANPDAAGTDLEDAFELHYLTPRELVPGDRIVLNGQYVALVIEVSGAENWTIGSSSYECVRVDNTYSDAHGKASGTGYALVVCSGEYTGLVAYSTAEQSYSGAKGNETKHMTNVATCIRE